MQFDHEESGEERRRRQRDYHAFLDAQVEARRKVPPPQTRNDDVEAAARLPVLPSPGRLKHQPNPPPHGSDANPSFAKYGDLSRLQVLRGADAGGGGGGGGGLGGNLDRAGSHIDGPYQGEHLNKLEQRLETEVQRRGLLERKVGSLGQKLQSWMADSTASISSLGARDAAVTEVREQARYLDAELARVQERQSRIENTLSLAPKVQEMTQQQVKALEEEARTRIQADEVRAARFRQAVERVSDEVQGLASRLGAEENSTSQRVAILEAALTGEAKGTREATRQLGEHVKALGAAYSGSESNMAALCQSLRRIETRQEEQHAFAGGITEQLVSRQQIQESLTTATSEKLDALKTSLANELSGMMTDTARRVVESTNVPQAITLLKGRVEITEERLANVADKSLRSLEEELVGLRAEMTRLERQIEADPAADNLAALGSSVTTAQGETQSQLRELQDTLSAEITARRRNALRLAEAQAASTEGGRESAVQVASGLRARCLELEELVARLTQDVRTAQEELSSQTQAQLSATQERNSRAVGKLEESLTGLRRLVAQQDADTERNWAKSSARASELEALITDNKDSLREADERARNAVAAMEARRQAQGQQFLDKLATTKSEEMARTDALELALGEHRHATREAVETGYRANRTRSDELHAEMLGLEERLATMAEDAQMKEAGRAEALLQKTQDQINREVARVRQAADRVATDTNDLRVQVLTEETSRIEDVQKLQRDVSKMAEASESRLRLWAEGRLQAERAATEEVLERAQAQSGMVRTLLDEAVSAISKELTMQKTESNARSVALEDLVDGLVSGLETRLTEVDKGAAKKRRLGELSKETGARIGEIERHLRQTEQELKDNLEVKLAVSSLVCTVSDQAATQRLDQRASEELKLEKKRKNRATTNEGKLKAELEKTNATVSSLQADLGAATAWRTGVDELESKLMARIEELKSMAEAAKSAAATASAEAAAARKAEAEATKAREEAAAELARAKEAAAASAAAERDAGAQGQPAKKAVAKKVTDFAAMNDELEADDSSASSSNPEDEQTDNDDDADDESALKPRVGQIEKELKGLKLRLEEGIAEMTTLRQEMLVLVSNRRLSSGGNDGDGARGGAGHREPKRYSGRAAGRRERAPDTFTTSPRSLGDGSGEETGSDEDRQAGTSNTPPMSPKSSVSYTPPLSPAISAIRTPPRPAASDLTPAGTARGGNASDASDTRSRGAAKSVASEYHSESEESDRDENEAGDRRSPRSSRAGFAFTTASEGRDAAVRNLEETDGEESDGSKDGAESRRSEAASDAGSASISDGDRGDDGGGGSDSQSEEEDEEEDEEDEEQGGEEGEEEEQEEEEEEEGEEGGGEDESSDDEEEENSDHGDASAGGSASERSNEESDQDNDDGSGASDASGKNPEDGSDSENEGGGSEEEGSDSVSERDGPESQRSSSDDEGSTGRRKT